MSLLQYRCLLLLLPPSLPPFAPSSLPTSPPSKSIRVKFHIFSDCSISWKQILSYASFKSSFKLNNRAERTPVSLFFFPPGNKARKCLISSKGTERISVKPNEAVEEVILFFRSFFMISDWFKISVSKKLTEASSARTPKSPRNLTVKASGEEERLFHL
jgi:hypothetical protein